MNFWENDPIVGGVPAQVPKEEDRFWEKDAVVLSPVAKSSVTRRVLGDTGVALAKGVVGLPETAIGLLDISTSPLVDSMLPKKIGEKRGQSGYIGKAAKEIGINFAGMKQILDTFLTPEQQANNKAVNDAVGLINTVKAYASHPSVIGQSIAESVPSMVGGAGIARKIISVFPTVSPIVAAAIGEGVVSAGQNFEQARQSSKTGLLSGNAPVIFATSGAATGLLSIMGGKLAKKLGITDIDTLLAGGTTATAKRSIFLKVIEGAISEGIIEELPQSIQEQMAQNLSLGRPAWEGVVKAGLQGMLTGMATGAGGNVISSAAEWVKSNPEAAAKLAASPDPASRKAAKEAGVPATDRSTREAYAQAAKASIAPQNTPETPPSSIPEGSPADIAEKANPGRVFVADENGNIVDGNPPKGFATQEEAQKFADSTSELDIAVKPAEGGVENGTVQERGATTLDVQEPPGNGEAVGTALPDGGKVAEEGGREGVEEKVETEKVRPKVGTADQVAAQKAQIEKDKARVIGEEYEKAKADLENATDKNRSEAQARFDIAKSMVDRVMQDTSTEPSPVKPKIGQKLTQSNIIPENEGGFRLAGEKANDNERVMREKEAEAKRVAEFKANQQELIAQPEQKIVEPKSQPVSDKQAADIANAKQVNELALKKISAAKKKLAKAIQNVTDGKGTPEKVAFAREDLAAATKAHKITEKAYVDAKNKGKISRKQPKVIDENLDNARKSLVGAFRRPERGESYYNDSDVKSLNPKYFGKKGAKNLRDIGDVGKAVSEFYEGARELDFNEGLAALKGRMPREASESVLDKRATDQVEGEVYKKMLSMIRESQTDAGTVIENPELNALAKQFPRIHKEAVSAYKKELESQSIDTMDFGMGAARAVTPRPAPTMKKGEKDIIGDVKPGTSSNYAYTDKMRAVLGMKEREPTVRKSDEELMAEAGRKLSETNGIAGQDLTAKMKDDPTYVPTDVDEMLLVYEMTRLQERRNDAIEAVHKGTGTMEQADAAQADLEAVYALSERGGQEWGRAGRARQILLADDFSVINLERRKLAIKRSKYGQEKATLTPEEIAEAKMQSEAEKAKRESFMAEFEREKDKLTAEMATSEEADAIRHTQEDAERKANSELQKIISENQLADNAIDELRRLKDSDRDHVILRGIFKRASEGIGRNRIFTQERIAKISSAADEARAMLKSMNTQFTAGLDPTRLVAFAKIGAEYIAKGLAFTERMILEFGEGIRPHLNDIGKEAYKMLVDQAVSDSELKLENAAKKPRKGETIRNLVRKQVDAGVYDFKKVMENVRKQVQDMGGTDGLRSDPNLREVMDRFSGYDRPPKMPSTKIEAETMVRLRHKAVAMSRLADLLKGKKPRLYGKQRYTSTAEERENSRQIRVLMRELGFTSKTSEQQMKSALDAAKTRMWNSIEDIERALSSGKRIEKSKKTVAISSDPEAIKLEAHLKEQKELYDQAFAKESLSEDQRLELAIKAAERNADFWEARQARAEQGDFSKGGKTEYPWSPEIAEAKKRVKDAQEAIRALEDTANPPLTETQKKLKGMYDRTLKQIEAGKAKIASGDFAPKPAKVPFNISDHPDLMKKKMEWEAVKAQIKAGEAKARYEAMDGWEKTRHWLKAVWDVSRNTASSIDVSAMGTQGWFLLLSHPKDWGTAFRSIRAISPKESERLFQQYLERENQRNGIDAISKIAINRTDGQGNFRSAEDNFNLDLSREIPVIGKGIDASNRMYGNGLNAMRSGLQDVLLNGTELGREIMANPKNLDAQKIQFLKDIGQGVNILTGRGNLPGAEVWARVGWAPRFLKSMFDVMTLKPIRGSKTKEARIVFAKEYARVAMTLGALYGTALLMHGIKSKDNPDGVEVDSRSSEFGAIPLWGHFRWNPVAKLKQQIVFATRMLSGKTKVGQKVVNIRGEDVPYGKGASDVIGRYLQSKAHPSLGALLAVATGKTFTGKEATPARLLIDAVSPLSPRQAIETFQETDPGSALAFSVLNSIGLGIDPEFNNFKVMKVQAENDKEFQKRLGNLDIDRLKEMFSSSEPDEQKILAPYIEKKLGSIMWSATDDDSTGRDIDAIRREARKLADGGPLTTEIFDKARMNLSERATNENARLEIKRAEAIAELRGMTEEKAVELMKKDVIGRGDIPLPFKNGVITPYGKRVARLRKLYREMNEE